MKRHLLQAGLLLVFIAGGIRAEVLLRPGMDTTVNPRVDFYNYADGTWMKNTEIPANKSVWGSFVELGDQNWPSEAH